MRRFLYCPLILLLAACSEGRSRNNPGTTMTQPPPATGAACGNGVAEGIEACDGDVIANGVTCAGLGLGGGNLGCSSDCKLDLTTCDFPDYCTANNLYDNGMCDACEQLGGVRDPDCMTACGADGMCGDRFEPLIGAYVCRAAGQRDPDCGSCGNGIIEGAELCDGQTFPMGSHRCEDWGFIDGSIGCNGDCTPNFGSCRAIRCGDGLIEGNEACEGTDVQGATCTGLGFAAGEVTCGADCQLVTSSCIAAGCGNGIKEVDEVCEIGFLDGQTCESQGFAGGTLACSGTCELDTSGCVSPGCGNGIIEDIEECEGMNLNGQTCQTQGFLGGDLACSTTSCTFDTSACVAPGCGNMILEPGTEQCEGMNFGGETCQTQGFAAGTLSCDSMCMIDTSNCTETGCGNNIIEPGEQCDGTNFGGESCYTLTGGVGALVCNSCQRSTANCTPTCGDGVVNSHELCDGMNFRNNSSTNCADLGLGSGTVTCNQATCRLNLNGCSLDACSANNWYNDGACDPCHLLGGMMDPDCNGCGANGACVDFFSGLVGDYACHTIDPNIPIDPDCTCGNGLVDPAEACDGTSFATTELGTCSYYGFSSGVVTCTPNCVPDPSLCQ